jgi:alpha/beta superfamily hydrolase
VVEDSHAMGEVRRLWIAGRAGKLEAALRVASPARAAAVLAHPHPLHGGTLDHPVLFHADRALNRAGFVTLRFNFRGVGASEGAHDEGRGEVDDVAAAARWIGGLARGLPLLVVGFSFGSWCALRHAVADEAVAGVIAIGVPVALRPLEELPALGRPLAIVQAEHDEFGEPRAVRERIRGLDPPAELQVVSGTTHLFPGRAPDAAAAVAAAAERILARL